jgi:hypothetical protein
MTTTQAAEFAEHWIGAWNARDIQRILAHYSDDVAFSSPFVKSIAADKSGWLHGREALRKYFVAALANFPALHFHLRSVLVGVSTLTLLYDSVNGLLAAETMTLGADGKINQVWAQYDRLE